MSLTGTTFCFSCYFWLQPVSQNVNTIKADNKAEQPNFLFAVAESKASVTIPGLRSNVVFQSSENTSVFYSNPSPSTLSNRAV